MNNNFAQKMVWLALLLATVPAAEQCGEDTAVEIVPACKAVWSAPSFTIAIKSLAQAPSSIVISEGSVGSFRIARSGSGTVGGSLALSPGDTGFVIDLNPRASEIVDGTDVCDGNSFVVTANNATAAATAVTPRFLLTASATLIGAAAAAGTTPHDCGRMLAAAGMCACVSCRIYNHTSVLLVHC